MASPLNFPISPANLALAAVAVLFVLPAANGQSPSSQPAPQHPNPVLVELFTSEGCSDCPPADTLLERLDAQQPISGAQIVVLSEHVTYWNHQGWMDPFSLVDIDQRQQAYVQQFSLPSPATPEFVVDGAAQVAGMDPNKLVQEITTAGAAPKLDLELGDAHRAADGSITFTVKATAPKTTLLAAVAENATQSVVARGENAGKTLHYIAVVRVLKDFGSNAADGRPLRLSGGDLLKAEKDNEPLRLIAFLVSKKDGHVVAVAQQTLSN